MPIPRPKLLLYSPQLVLQFIFLLIFLAQANCWAQPERTRQVSLQIKALNDSLGRPVNSGERRWQLRQRAKLLAELIETDPALAISVALPAESLTALSSAYPEEPLEARGSWQGDGQTIVEDDFEHGMSRKRFQLRAGAGIFSLYSNREISGIECGRTITVTGVRLGERIAVESLKAGVRTASSCSTVGQQNVAVLIVSFPTTANTVTTSLVQSAFFGAGRSLANYWQESSYGAMTMSGSVFGPVVLNQSYDCSTQTSELASAAINAFDATVDFRNYTRLFILYPRSPSCSGYGTIGCFSGWTSPLHGSFSASIAWIGVDSGTNNDLLVDVAAHEGGHGLGLEHASSYAYTSEALGAPGAAPTFNEYGDLYSAMGISYTFNGQTIIPQYAAQQKQQLGWLAAGNSQTVTSSGTYNILPYETGSGLKTIRVQRGATDKYLWLEYRQSLGNYDTLLGLLSQNIYRGALIHYEDPDDLAHNGHTELLDFNPQTSGNFSDAVLDAGRTWTDPYTNLSLTVNSATSAGLNVTVTYTPCASISPSNRPHGAGAETGSVSVTAAGNCSWSASTPDSWISITAGASGTGSGTVSYAVTANPSTSSRSGTINIGGQTFTMNQAGACSYALSGSPYAAPAAASSSSFGVTTTCSWSALSNNNFITITAGSAGTGSGTVSFSVAANSGAARSGTITVGTATLTVNQSAAPATAGLRFLPMVPCRVVDTRAGQGTSGAFGPPSIQGGTGRDFPFPSSPCGIPAAAKAYSLNITVVPPGALGYLTVWPSGQAQPLVSTLNSLNGDVLANAAIVPAGSNGGISVFASNTTDVIIDINGYFAPTDFMPPAFGSYVLFPVAPCRAVDTRAGQGTSGAFGPPVMSAGTKRDFPLPTSSCGIPSAARAYSVNITVVPSGPLGYLTAWPTGFTQPGVSTLNSVRGKVVANAAIVPAGSSGAISLFVSNTTDVIVDINGYFADPTFVPASGKPGLLFNPATPCRIADTRPGQGTSGAFGPPSLAALGTRDFPIPLSACATPTTAQAYSLNFTVVPPTPLGYLTAWPTGQAQPLVSTLNSPDGSVVANAAIVPAGTNGAISLYASNITDAIIDLNGYFAP